MADGLREKLAETVMDALPHSAGCAAHGGICLCAVPRAKRAVALADTLLPVVQTHADQQTADELRDRARGVRSLSDEETDRDVQAALDDVAARLEARAAALNPNGDPR